MSEKKALSVINPISYLICLGFKDVENRSWNTTYRGRIYIHSSGEYDEFTLQGIKYPKSLIKQVDALIGEVNLEDDATISEVLEELKKEKYKRKHEAINYIKTQMKYEAMLKKHYGINVYEETNEKLIKTILQQKKPFHKTSSIIGHVSIVDIVRNSNSVWAEQGMYHWVLKDPMIYEKPVINVKGALRLFDVSHIDLP